MEMLRARGYPLKSIWVGQTSKHSLFPGGWRSLRPALFNPLDLTLMWTFTTLIWMLRWIWCIAGHGKHKKLRVKWNKQQMRKKKGLSEIGRREKGLREVKCVKIWEWRRDREWWHVTYYFLDKEVYVSIKFPNDQHLATKSTLGQILYTTMF